MEKPKLGLPPLLDRFENGKAVWKRFESVNFEILGFFLSCHLVIEHYMDEFLTAYSPSPFRWDAANLTFAQKVSLIADLKQFSEPYTIPSILKHFNSLRNKMSHDVAFTLKVEDLLPEVQFLQKISKRNLPQDSGDVKAILDDFTGMVCVYFAAIITHCGEQKFKGLNGNWKL